MNDQEEILAKGIVSLPNQLEHPEVVDVSYDLWLLRVTVTFEDQKNPVYLEFEGVRGFRVLDEGDLIEFWSNDCCLEGWLVEITKGGWFALEQSRSGFITSPEQGFREYLIAGINACVSVIAYEVPRVYQAQP